ncbi:hypothetical protein Acsp06_57940 [Actinomycetospora sp. NBRC 106375]|uniref:hypothetical protein n=1 Tax=Actinomycetospora sp. NBRC 106375 TaxID=3032207 RepID=UPI0024A4035F|nr:hypothetical protein [Actinomycetospora sp. NBRC 106375]GLZ49609.1 hypothetical protein Acsp06_57940 [Actinomycetospora sp. NBRC 106375]
MPRQGDFWSTPRPLGHPGATAAFASVASPLLAGFSIAAIVALAGRTDRGLRGDLAIMFFSLAIACLVFAIQAGLAAASRHVAVAERVAVHPEKARDPELMHEIRSEQWIDEDVASHHRLLARHTYNTGILAFLAGLLCVAVPGPGDWNVPRVAALVIVGSAIGVELVQQIHRPRLLAAFLAPSDEDLRRGYIPFRRREPPPLPTDLVAEVLGRPPDGRAAGRCADCPHPAGGSEAR